MLSLGWSSRDNGFSSESLECLYHLDASVKTQTASENVRLGFWCGICFIPIIGRECVCPTESQKHLLNEESREGTALAGYFRCVSHCISIYGQWGSQNYSVFSTASKIFRGWFNEHICASYITDTLFIQTFTFSFCCQHLHHKCLGKPLSEYKRINNEEKINVNVPSDVWSIWTVNTCEEVKGHSDSLTTCVFSISQLMKSQLLTVAQSLKGRNS